MSDSPKEEPKKPSTGDHESRVRVFRYLSILFAAAFLLLLLAFLMQNRTNQEAISDLTEAVTTVHHVVEENTVLRERNAELEQKMEQLSAALEAAKASDKESRAAFTLTKQRLNALHTLNNIRALYNDGKYREARNLISQNEPLLEQHLEEYSTNYLSDEGRAIYDPLEAYRTLVDWLN